jgi:protein phosphatase 1 regulatory subunit 7
MQEEIRITDPASLDGNLIDKELKKGKHVIVQFSRNIYNCEILSELNDFCKNYDKSFGVRFYGHDYTAFDCETLEAISDIKCLYIDCISIANNLYVLGSLSNIQKLSLGVYELKETELWETKTKALNLQHLSEYSNLNYLRLRSHTKNISAIENLKNLNYLSLELIKNTPVSFINNLKNLKTLNFILGSRENIHEIDENTIEHLEIVWVRGFNDISNIGRFKKLKFLKFEDNIKLKKICFDKEMPLLKTLSISNCKTLNSLTGLYNLTSLDRIGIYQTNIDFDTFIKQELPASLKAVRFYTSKNKLNDEIKIRIKDKGYTD